MENKFKISILPKKQRELFNFLSGQVWLDSFYLAGGTALALQIGHRQSIDFDFFTKSSFDKKKVVKKAVEFGTFELFTEGVDTIHGALNGVQISFFRLEDKLLGETINFRHLHVASMLDIAAMKLNAVSGRGTKKDFIDLYFLLEKFSLPELFEGYEAKYGKTVSNNYHLLKSLTYFGDAEKQPSPKMIVKVSWDEVKRSIIQSARNAGIF